MYLIRGDYRMYIKIDHSQLPPKLNPTEQRKYLELMCSGNVEAKKIIIEHNMRLVKHVSDKYYSNEASDELFSVGCMGLIKAASTYKLDKGTSFSTYAGRCIENEILMFFRSNKKHSRETSFNAPISEVLSGDDDIVIQDVVAVDEDTAFEKIAREEDRIMVRSVLTVLGDSLKGKVIDMRFGLNGEPKTQQEIAEILGYSRSYISRLEKCGLEDLKAALLSNSPKKVEVKPITEETKTSKELVAKPKKELKKGKEVAVNNVPKKEKDMNIKKSAPEPKKSHGIVPKRLTVGLDAILSWFPNNTKEEVLEAISKLPEYNKKAFDLRHGLNGSKMMSINEISIQLNLKPASVNACLGKTKIILKGKLSGEKEVIVEITNEINPDNNHYIKIRESKIGIDVILSWFSNNTFDEVISSINKLSTYDKKLLELRHGLNGIKPLSISEIAILLHIKPVSVYNSLRVIKKRMCELLLTDEVKSEITADEIKLSPEPKEVSSIDNDNEQSDSLIFKLEEAVNQGGENGTRNIILEKEMAILYLSAGYINNRYFSAREISKIIDVPEEYVRRVRTRIIAHLEIAAYQKAISEGNENGFVRTKTRF